MQCCSHTPHTQRLTHGSRKAGAAKKAYNTTTTHINNNPCTLRHRTPAAVRTNEKAYNYEKDCYTTHDPYEVALVGAALFAAFAWAGKSDYVDSTVTEMKNNGTYYALSERFPDYSDADLVHYYVEHYK